MVDFDKLSRQISHFEFCSRPSNATQNAPATVEDLERVIKNTANLFTSFLEEIKKSEKL